MTPPAKHRNPLLESALNAALSAVDARAYQSRHTLTVNRPDHQPPPRVFIPSQSRLRP